eukprot:TRINITY_DN40036_c0_g1_i1.p1 TRINITY_DN40036_c0_g1~~TRINITY_DN40036_c0_g1_i1.p1  ORF type:complete len:189 (-),score=79.42 TRINITY_DN40036_c0_g1_i1:11-538(-)
MLRSLVGSEMCIRDRIASLQADMEQETAARQEAEERCHEAVRSLESERREMAEIRRREGELEQKLAAASGCSNQPQSGWFGGDAGVMEKAKKIKQQLEDKAAAKGQSAELFRLRAQLASHKASLLAAEEQIAKLRPVRIEMLKRMLAKLARRCLLYTSDAADEEDSVDLGGRRTI